MKKKLYITPATQVILIQPIVLQTTSPVTETETIRGGGDDDGESDNYVDQFVKLTSITIPIDGKDNSHRWELLFPPVGIPV